MPTRLKQNRPDATLVTIRLGGDAGPPIQIHPDPAAFQTAAMQWSYVARNRERWRADGPDPAQASDGPLKDYLSPGALDRIARAEIVEVSLPWSPVESEGWEYRVFPWEYALSAVTRTRRTHSLTIVRHLRVEPTIVDPAVRLDRAATVECAPGRLAQFYDTRLEGDMMLQALGFEPAKAKDRLRDPTLDDLRRWIRDAQPSLLHLAGVDTHQAIALLGLERQYPSRNGATAGAAQRRPCRTDGPGRCRNWPWRPAAPAQARPGDVQLLQLGLARGRTHGGARREDGHRLPRRHRRQPGGPLLHHAVRAAGRRPRRARGLPAGARQRCASRSATARRRCRAVVGRLAAAGQGHHDARGVCRSAAARRRRAGTRAHHGARQTAAAHQLLAAAQRPEPAELAGDRTCTGRRRRSATSRSRSNCMPATPPFRYRATFDLADERRPSC
jgi:hypothetical protein